MKLTTDVKKTSQNLKSNTVSYVMRLAKKQFKLFVCLVKECLFFCSVHVYINIYNSFQYFLGKTIQQQRKKCLRILLHD